MDYKKIKANDIADITLLYCFENGLSVSPLKLQKILYYIQSWYMVHFNKELLFEEKPQAWINGPVYPTVYRIYKHIGRYNNITPRNSKLKMTLNEKEMELNLTEKQKSFLEAIYRKYGTMSHDKLVFLTHSEKPWSEKRENLSPFAPSQEELSTDTMYSYYNSLIKK